MVILAEALFEPVGQLPATSPTWSICAWAWLTRSRHSTRPSRYRPSSPRRRPRVWPASPLQSARLDPRPPIVARLPEFLDFIALPARIVRPRPWPRSQFTIGFLAASEHARTSHLSTSLACLRYKGNRSLVAPKLRLVAHHTRETLTAAWSGGPCHTTPERPAGNHGTWGKHGAIAPGGLRPTARRQRSRWRRPRNRTPGVPNAPFEQAHLSVIAILWRRSFCGASGKKLIEQHHRPAALSDVVQSRGLCPGAREGICHDSRTPRQAGPHRAGGCFKQRSRSR